MVIHKQEIYQCYTNEQALRAGGYSDTKYDTTVMAIALDDNSIAIQENTIGCTVYNEMDGQRGLSEGRVYFRGANLQRNIGITKENGIFFCGGGFVGSFCVGMGEFLIFSTFPIFRLSRFLDFSVFRFFGFSEGAGLV